MITADHARIPAAIALHLCAESPEALAVLCRVLWFARGSGECFASCATMRMAGAPMALPVLRRLRPLALVMMPPFVLSIALWISAGVVC